MRAAVPFVVVLVTACGAVLGIEDRHVDQARESHSDSGRGDDDDDGGGAGDDDDDDLLSDAGVVGDTAAPPPADGGDTTSRYRAEVLKDTPALYFRFGEPAGATSLRNEVVGLTATYPATGVTQGVSGALAGDPDTAVSFTGGLITVSEGLDFAGLVPCAIELWTKRDGNQAGTGFLLDHQVWSNPRNGWGVETQNGAFTYERWTTIPGPKMNTGTSTEGALSVGVWHHWVVTFDGNKPHVFADGVSKQSTAAPEMAAAPGKWLIGGAACTSCDNHLFYKGSLDEVAIYTHTLTPERISAHFAAAH